MLNSLNLFMESSSRPDVQSGSFHPGKVTKPRRRKVTPKVLKLKFAKPVPSTQVKAYPTTSETPFVWPKSVQEFMEFDPIYTKKWLKSRKCPIDLIEDYSQGLLLHLCTPNKECLARGFSDKMMLYKPERLGDAVTVAGWAFWLNTVLSNQYSKLIKRQQRGGVTGSKVISLGETDDESRSKHGTATWWLLLDPHERPQFETSIQEVYNPITSRIFLAEIIRVVREEVGPDALKVLAAVSETDTVVQAAAVLGMQSRMVHRILKNIRLVLGATLGLSPDAIQAILEAA